MQCNVYKATNCWGKFWSCVKLFLSTFLLPFYLYTCICVVYPISASCNIVYSHTCHRMDQTATEILLLRIKGRRKMFVSISSLLHFTTVVYLISLLHRYTRRLSYKRYTQEKSTCVSFYFRREKHFTRDTATVECRASYVGVV